MFGNMFKFNQAKNIVTLFHKASTPASMRVNTLLKQISAESKETATEDQASDHRVQPKVQAEFELEVTEEAPTPDQLRSILEYLGAQKAGTIIKGASDEATALKKLAANGDSFERPVVVDWVNGKVIAGDNESEILKMVEALNKK